MKTIGIWNLKIDVIDYEKIEPSRCLFWLTGGHSEWNNLENYNKILTDIIDKYNKN